MSIKTEFTEFSELLKKLVWSLSGAFFVGFFLLAYPTEQTFVEKFFASVKNNLVPEGVKVVSFSPLDAFSTEIFIALVFGFLIVSPLIAIQLAEYFAPALEERERRIIKYVSIPAVLLFITGAIYSYIYVVTPTFVILYHFAERLGTEPLLTVPDLVSTAITLAVVAGLSFELPILMILLNRLGVVDKSIWASYWRHFFFACLAFFAVFTPDGSGITMLILSIPMILLYCVGWGLSRRY